jgi:folylpolyglutamate synthase/dihydropteroate synthase
VAELAAKWNVPIVVEEDTRQALGQAIAASQPDDIVLVTGSLYLVGDAKRLLPDLLPATGAEALMQVKG